MTEIHPPFCDDGESVTDSVLRPVAAPSISTFRSEAATTPAA